MPPGIFLEEGEEGPIRMAGWLLARRPVLPFAFDEIHIIAGEPPAGLLVSVPLEQQPAIPGRGEIDRLHPAEQAGLPAHLRVLQLLPHLPYAFRVLVRPA